jgi:transcriptional regulator with XRE-family HTH domain
MKNKDSSGYEAEELEKIRENIKFQRKKQGLTQIELAHKMGITQRVISYYENEAPTITLDAIAKIAKALDVPKRKILDTDREEQLLPVVSRAMQRRIDLIKDLSPKAQRTISDMIDTMAKAENVGA